MMIRDLLLPNGWVMEFGTDRIKRLGDCVTKPLDWAGADGLAGNGTVNRSTGTRQPFIGCPTGGDIIADLLMRQLAKERLQHKQEGDDDPRWNLVG